MKQFFAFLFALLVSSSVSAQVAVKYNSSGQLTEPSVLKVPTGKEIRVENGGTFTIASGATSSLPSSIFTWASVSKTGSSLADLTTRSASDLSSGTLPDARFPATLPAASGVNLTALNATQLTSGTIPDARFPGVLPAVSGVNLSSLNASALGSGTLPDARFPATLPAASGVNLTALNATQLTSGTVPLARMYLGAVDVRYYGADGTDGSDDHVAIQAALDQTTYKTIIIPAGTWRLGVILQIPSGKHLKIDRNATLLRTAATTSMIHNKADGVTSAYAANTDITIEGGLWDNNIASFPGACTTIAIGHASDVIIKDMWIKDTPVWHSIEINGSQRVSIERVRSTGCTGAEALQFDTMVNSGVFPWFGPYNDAKCKDVWVRDCYFSTTATAIGSHSNPAIDGLVISGCVFDGTTAQAIKPNGYSKVLITGNEFRSCLIGYSGATTGLTIVNNKFVTCGTVYAGTNSGVIVADNYITSPTTACLDVTSTSDAQIHHNTVTLGSTFNLLTWTGVTPSATVNSKDNWVNGALWPILSQEDLDELHEKSFTMYGGVGAAGGVLSLQTTAPAPGTGDFAVSAWYYPFEIRANDWIVGRDSGGGGPGVRVNADGTITSRAASLADLITSTDRIVANQWNHILVWRSGTTFYLSINGRVPASAADPVAPFDANGPTSVGSQAVAGCNGRVARVQVLNFAPTAAERVSLFRRRGALDPRWRLATMTSVAATAILPRTFYKITAVGTTDFTLVGAASNTVGVTFMSNDTAGLGSGTVIRAGALWALSDGDQSVGSLVPDASGNSYAFKMVGTCIQTKPASSGVLGTVGANTAISNTTAETALVTGQWGDWVLRPGSFYAVSTHHLKITGFLSNTGTPTINIRIIKNATLLVETGAIAMSTVTGNQPFELDVYIQGNSSTSVDVQGTFRYKTSSTSAWIVHGVPAATVTVLDALESLAANVVWGTASASNNITSVTGWLRKLN